MAKKLIGNQEGLGQRQYKLTPSGYRRAVLVHILGKNDCPKCWEELENHYTDGVNVWKRIPLEPHNN